MSIPAVSIILPTHNAGKHITQCVNGLDRQKTHITYEIIVVDDVSSDNTLELLKASPAKNVRILTNKSVIGSYACRNLGANVAKGEVLVFLEASCIPSLNWLEKMTLPILSGKSKAVQGVILPRNTGFWIQLERARFQIYRGINTKSFAVEKKTFELLGGFDESFLWWWGDVEFLRARMESVGLDVTFQDTVVYCSWPSNLIKALEKNKVYGLGRFRFLSEYRPGVSFHKKARYGPLHFLLQCFLDGGKESYKLTRERVKLPFSFKIAFFFYYLTFYVSISIYTYLYARNPMLRHRDKERLMY